MDRIQETGGISQERGEFSKAAPEETIQRVVEKLKERNMEVIVVEDGDAARQLVLERLDPAAEVHSGKSKTLEDAGIFKAPRARPIHLSAGSLHENGPQNPGARDS